MPKKHVQSSDDYRNGFCWGEIDYDNWHRTVETHTPMSTAKAMAKLRRDKYPTASSRWVKGHRAGVNNAMWAKEPSDLRSGESL